MKAAIYSNTLLIGHSDLKVGDESMGHVYGEFIPTVVYFENIQQYAWQFWSTTTPDYVQWESLNICIQLENGLPLEPEGGITINQLQELKDEPIKINIAGLDQIAIAFIKGGL